MTYFVFKEEVEWCKLKCIYGQPERESRLVQPGWNLQTKLWSKTSKVYIVEVD